MIQFDQETRQFSAESVYKKYNKKYKKLRDQGHSHELAIKKLNKQANTKSMISAAVSGSAIGWGLGKQSVADTQRAELRGINKGLASVGKPNAKVRINGKILSNPDKYFEKKSNRGGMLALAGSITAIGSAARSANRIKAIKRIDKENKDK